MELKVYGTGCAKCKTLYQEADKAVQASGLAVSLSKVEDMEAIMAAGVMRTPALQLDGKMLSSGRIPSSAEIQGWLKAKA
jgi:small redox-active disulfide protein 2